MCIVNLDEIPDEGLTIDQFAPADEWLERAMQEVFGDKRQEDDEAHLQLTLVKSGDQVTAVGGIYIHLNPTCDRCAKPFGAEQQIPIHLVFVPRAKISAGSGKVMGDEETPVEEDLDFSLYDDRQLDVGAVVAEQVVLAQPMQYICKKSCKGLCPGCGKDLNSGPCTCKEKTPKESPFAALKGMKVRKK